MQIFKRRPEPLTPWTDAPKYTANGYQTLPIELSQAELKLEEPRGGGWMWPLGNPQHPEHYTVGVHAGIFPRNGGGNMTLEQCQKTWLAVLRVDRCESKKLRRDIEALMAPVVGDAPVRTIVDSHDILVPLRIDVPDCRAFGLRSRPYGASVTITGGAVCFLAGPGGRFEWRGGRDLLAVRRDELPLLELDAASRLISAIDVLLMNRAA